VLFRGTAQRPTLVGSSRVVVARCQKPPDARWRARRPLRVREVSTTRKPHFVTARELFARTPTARVVLAADNAIERSRRSRPREFAASAFEADSGGNSRGRTRGRCSNPRRPGGEYRIDPPPRREHRLDDTSATQRHEHEQNPHLHVGGSSERNSGCAVPRIS
jgi:hypothetical protein